MKSVKRKSQASGASTINADTSFLIALSRDKDEWHAKACEWAEHLEKNKWTVFVSSIALSEYAVRGEINELMMTGLFIPVDFNPSDARITGELFSKWKQTLAKECADKDAAKNDIKILANAIRTNASHILTADKDMPSLCKGLGLLLKTINFRESPCSSLTAPDGQIDFKNLHQ